MKTTKITREESTDTSMDIGWNFDNTYLNLPDIFFTKQKPTPVKSPNIFILNKSYAETLGLDTNALENHEAASIFAGNKIPKEASPIAQAYAGHQFGHFTMLGDGRAILLGEHITPQGERFDIQLKGSGRTKYSRGGDGRAALGPMLREYIISEAMHNLGIPTTRSLAVIASGEHVIREEPLQGAILTRVASSHIRVGTFQYVSAYGSNEELKTLADYTIERHFPELSSDDNKYLLLLGAVVIKQAELIAKWQLVGFIHGVMNTDNMTISGETIDYGPCAFMDTYSLSTVFSSIDANGRYAYGNQPKIGIWNLSRFAETLLPLIHEDQDKAIELATEEVSEFSNIYNHYWTNGMRNKLGMFGEEAEDKDIIADLLTIMEKYRADYTNTFRYLTKLKLNENCSNKDNSNKTNSTEWDSKEDDLFDTKEYIDWKARWENRLSKQEESEEKVAKLMKNNNPAIIPRNYRVEDALSAAEQGDLTVMENLLNALENPYSYTKEQDEYALLSPACKQPYRTFCGT